MSNCVVSQSQSQDYSLGMSRGKNSTVGRTARTAIIEDVIGFYRSPRFFSDGGVIFYGGLHRVTARVSYSLPIEGVDLLNPDVDVAALTSLRSVSQNALMQLSMIKLTV
jgi:hypothetical protein